MENIGKGKNGKFIVCGWFGNPKSCSDKKRDFLKNRLKEELSKWHLIITRY